MGAQEHPFAVATSKAIQQARNTVVAVAHYIADLTWAFHQQFGPLLQKLAKEFATNLPDFTEVDIIEPKVGAKHVICHDPVDL
eukprot:12916406-Prorocentrum_lima.AAC.1